MYAHISLYVFPIVTFFFRVKGLRVAIVSTFLDIAHRPRRQEGRELVKVTCLFLQR